MQDTTSKYSSPVVRPPFSLFKSEATEQKGTPAMTASKKLTGAAAKSSRQSKLSVVRPTDEQQPTQQQQEPTVNTQPATEQIPVTEYTQVTLADMMAQRRAIDAQIKAAKASQPKVEKQPKPERTLAHVIEQQDATVGIGHVLYMAQRAQARIRMGQDIDSAVNDVARRENQAAIGALELFQDGGYPSLRAALMAWCAVNAPATVTKQHTQVSEGESTDEH